MNEIILPPLDPRIRRTRHSLCEALRGLLAEKSFDQISVQDLAERSTVNRATFYDHFQDKFALLEEMIGVEFLTLFERRMEGAGGTCEVSRRLLIQSVCDYLAGLAKRCPLEQRQFAPIVEAKIKSLLRDFLVAGMNRGNASPPAAEMELKATMASWAIYGAALEWNRNPDTQSDVFANGVQPLIARILQAAA